MLVGMTLEYVSRIWKQCFEEEDNCESLFNKQKKVSLNDYEKCNGWKLFNSLTLI